MPHSLTKSFWGRSTIFHFGAIISTYILVITGFDWRYFDFFSSEPKIRLFLFPAIIIGGFLPLFLPLTLVIIGYLKKSSLKYLHILNTGFALGQAAILGWFISSFYKALTGRVHPIIDSAMAIDLSEKFQFGFMRGGIFWGWPSGHTTVAFAMAITVLILYPRKKWMRYLAIIYALYIGIGVSSSVHWFSDFLAGALIGTTIGFEVGENFKKQPDAICG